MGFFRRKVDPERQLATAIAKRGVPGRGTVVSMHETGQRREGGGKEVEFNLVFTPEGSGKVTVNHRQFMNLYTLHGLAPGEPVKILYDRDDPTRLVVEGHPRYRTQVIDGDMVVVEVEDLEAEKR